MNDNEIIELYLSRDEEAITQSANKYGARLRHIANNILNDRESAKECENDTYLKAWNMIPPHEPRDQSTDAVMLIDGTAQILYPASDLPAGKYRLKISQFEGGKKADQPLPLSGEWVCEFTITR